MIMSVYIILYIYIYIIYICVCTYIYIYYWYIYIYIYTLHGLGFRVLVFGFVVSGPGLRAVTRGGVGIS